MSFRGAYYRSTEKKVRILSETITDDGVRRFLLEAGLSGNNFNKGNVNNIIDMFDSKISSDEGISYNGKLYRLEFHPPQGNSQKKGTRKFTINGENKYSAQGEAGILPNNSNGDRIREAYYNLRENFVKSYENSNSENNKLSEFGLTEDQAREYSQFMNAILSGITETNQAEKLNVLDNKLKELERDTEQAKTDGDQNRINQLNQLKYEYGKARGILSQKLVPEENSAIIKEFNKIEGLDTSLQKLEALGIKNISGESEYSMILLMATNGIEIPKAGTESGNFFKEQMKQYKEGFINAKESGGLGSFNLQFASAMNLFSENYKYDSILSLDSTGKEQNIYEYMDSFIGMSGISGNAAIEIKNKLLKLAFSQTVDNPLHLNSHGFDHTMMVTNFIKRNLEANPDDINNLVEKYGLEGEDAGEKAKFLFMLSGILHDFGYPKTELNGFDKPSHGPVGAILFEKEFGNLELWKIFPQNKVVEIKRDLFNSVLFHSADKREHSAGFIARTTVGNLQLLLGEIGKSAEHNQKGINTLKEYIRIYGRSDISIEYIELNTSSEFIEKLKEELDLAEENFKKVDKPEYLAGNGEKIVSAGDIEIEGFIGRYADGENKGIGIEFIVADVGDGVIHENNPLLKQIRDADNMDMTRRRLVGEQGKDSFMDMIYSLRSGSNNEVILNLLGDYDKKPEERKKIKQKLIQDSAVRENLETRK